MIKFYLNFKLDNIGRIEIAEPVGFSAVDFQLKQEEKRYARDISFGGGENEFEFTDRVHEEALTHLLYYRSKYGTESLVSLEIEFTDSTTYEVIGDLFYEEAKTDELTYFKCKVVQDSNQAKLKRNKEIKVDVLSDKDINGNAINPLVPDNILLKAKPIKQKSKWNQLNDYNRRQASEGDDNSHLFTFNPAVQLNQYDLEDSFTFFQTTEGEYVPEAGPGGGETAGAENDIKFFLFDKYKVVTAKQNLSNVIITTSDFTFDISTDVDNGGNGYVDGGLFVRYGENPRNSQSHTMFNYSLDEHQSFSRSGALSFTIPFLKRGDSVYFCFYQKVRQSASMVGPTNPRFETFINISNFNFNIIGTSVAYNTVVPSFRLYDVMKQNVKSISGLNIEAPHFHPGGQFYDQRLFNGNSLRGLTNRPFYITLKDIEEGIVEFNADYEIKPNNDVFFGLYRDFYTSNEIGFMNSVQFDSMDKVFNKRYTINAFNYKFNSYQSQKENTSENTFDVVHGETQWFRPNSLAANKKEVEVKWIRDAFDIEFNRRKGFEERNNTATQDDDKLFLIDTLPITDDSERNFQETATLLHSFTGDILKLTNDGTFNFLLLGLRIGESFEIVSEENQAVYTILDVQQNFISLERVSAGVSDDSGEFTTTFKYYVSSETANYMIWTNEGFTLIDNVNNPDNFANLKYTVKRNIINFYEEYLATANLYSKNNPFKNTFYKNNPSCATTYQGDYKIEGSDFVPTNPLLTPNVYENVTFICSFEQFKQYESKTRTVRGFFRFIDNLGNVRKGYPTSLKYSNYKNELLCDLEEKYEPATMQITTPIPGLIVINNETRLNTLTYNFVSNKLFIFDENGQPLYNGVFWSEVSINGAAPSSINELKNWLDLL